MGIARTGHLPPIDNRCRSHKPTIGAVLSSVRVVESVWPRYSATDRSRRGAPLIHFTVVKFPRRHRLSYASDNVI